VETTDVIQIGARNMSNFALLEEVGRARKPVLLKRGLSATLEELLMAAEYVVKEGNSRVILCERGIKTFETAMRFTLDIGAVPVAGLPAQVGRVLEAAPERCTVTDVGSTKGPVCAAAAGAARFIGGHPVCGSEAHGAEHARAELFDGATWFLTPVAATDPQRY